MSADADEWTVLAVGDAPSVRRLGSRVDPDVRVVSGAEAVRDEIADVRVLCLVVVHDPDGPGRLGIIDDLSTRYPSVPVLAVVRDADPRVGSAAVDAGADEYVPTPAFDAPLEALVERLPREPRGVEDPDGGVPARFLDAIGDPILVHERANDEILTANEACCDLLGYDRAELVGMPVSAVSGGRHTRAEAEAKIRRAAEAGAHTFEWTDRRKDGEEIPVEVTLSPFETGDAERVVAVVRDITERTARRRDLRTMTRAVDAASIGITLADATVGDLPLVYANEAFERLTGYGEGDVLGRDCRLLAGPSTDAATREEIRAAVEASEPARTELLSYRADSTPFWNDLAVAPVTDESGVVSHVAGFHRDVTMRKRRERLVGVMSRVLRHNLRNEMNVVKGFADSVDDVDEDVATMAGYISETAADLVDMTEKARTLEAAMRNPGEVSVRDVVPEVTRAAATVRSSHPEASVDVEAPERLDAVVADRLRLALRELGENAAEHAGPEPDVTYSVVETSDEVAIRVSDDGPGIDDTERQVLRTGSESPLEHGQGLGLWLVNWIVTGVGGFVTTTVDDGTTVTVHLPAPSGGSADERAYRYRQAAITAQPDQ
jgi:PAS domain S-box-containing protein